jgi:uncharacterized membrane protein
MLAPALVSWAARLGYLQVDQTPVAFMGNHYTYLIWTALAIAELIADKLPSIPSRKSPGPFVARLITGALCGATIGAAAHSILLPLVFAAGGAVAGTLGGAAARAKLAALFHRDFPAAIVEDIVAIGLGVLCLFAPR